MAKYKDGSEAAAGDRVRGPVSTHPGPVEGIVIAVELDRVQIAFPVPYQAVAGGQVAVSVANGWATLADCDRVEAAPWNK